MIKEEYYSFGIFPKNESEYFEYKESFVMKSMDKYIETICGFLNTNGGYLIFGIKDNLETVGLKNKNKEIDTFVLKIDSIIHEKKIVGFNIEDKEPYFLNTTNIKTKIIQNKQGKKFIQTKVIPKKNIKFQVDNGMIFYRLGASNYFEKTEKIYKQNDFDYAIKTVKEKAEQENRTNIELFNKTLLEKNNTIQILNNELEKALETNKIYQTHLDTALEINKLEKSQEEIHNKNSINNPNTNNQNNPDTNNQNNPDTNNQIINNQNDNILNNLFVLFFSCIK
jgi:predicted HTH transcriptional regulator